MMPVTDPPARVVFGFVVLTIPAFALPVADLERVQYWMLAVAVFSVCMITSGIRQQLHERRVRREIDRAEAEWPELLRDAGALAGRGDGITRLLQQRGYHDYFVRRWLAARLVLEVTASEPSACGTTGVQPSPGPI